MDKGTKGSWDGIVYYGYYGRYFLLSRILSEHHSHVRVQETGVFKKSKTEVV